MTHTKKLHNMFVSTGVYWLGQDEDWYASLSISEYWDRETVPFIGALTFMNPPNPVADVIWAHDPEYDPVLCFTSRKITLTPFANWWLANKCSDRWAVDERPKGMDRAIYFKKRKDALALYSVALEIGRNGRKK